MLCIDALQTVNNGWPVAQCAAKKPGLRGDPSTEMLLSLRTLFLSVDKMGSCNQELWDLK